MRLMEKEVYIEESPVLWQKPFTPDVMESDFSVKTGEWVCKDGYLIGKNPENAPGMIVSKGEFHGNVMLDFYATTVLPSTHDVNAMWSGHWNDETGERDMGYVVGLQGWWHGKLGFEKAPDYKFRAGTPLFPFEPGREYHIQVGSIDGHIFAAIDGKLCLEISDPEPIDTERYGQIGFEAYCSQIRIRDLTVRKIRWESVTENYDPEF